MPWFTYVAMPLTLTIGGTQAMVVGGGAMCCPPSKPWKTMRQAQMNGVGRAGHCLFLMRSAAGIGHAKLLSKRQWRQDLGAIQILMVPPRKVWGIFNLRRRMAGAILPRGLSCGLHQRAKILRWFRRPMLREFCLKADALWALNICKAAFTKLRALCAK